MKELMRLKLELDVNKYKLVISLVFIYGINDFILWIVGINVLFKIVNDFLFYLE